MDFFRIFFASNQSPNLSINLFAGKFTYKYFKNLKPFDSLTKIKFEFSYNFADDSFFILTL